MAKINARLQHKIDIEANWLLTEERFTPLKGEFIIYDVDSNHSATRLKIGDGVTNVNQLPFAPFSAYDVAKAQGFEGSEEQWLNSLKGRGIKEIRKQQASVGSNGETLVTIELTDNSTETFKVYNGESGDPGQPGNDGVGIASIDAIPSVDNTHTDIQINFSDNSEPATFTVYNGVVTEDQLDQIQESIVGEIQEKCHTEVFSTYEDLYKTLTGITIQWNEENGEWEEIQEEESEEALIEREALLTSFQSGDVFLIKDLNVPDYWWESFGDATSFTIPRANYPTEIIVPGFGAARILETQKTDLTHHLELDSGTAGTIDLTNYKLRVGAAGDTGLEKYITFILEEA